MKITYQLVINRKDGYLPSFSQTKYRKEHRVFAVIRRYKKQYPNWNICLCTLDNNTLIASKEF
jgi:hypothetical protein